MKLCKKCRDEIRWKVTIEADFDTWPEESVKPVSESECEFWAHQDLRFYKELHDDAVNRL